MNSIFEKNLHELTERLAYEYWERRGRPIGSPEVDWFAAERFLGLKQRRSEDDFSLCSLRLEPDEGPCRPCDASERSALNHADSKR